MYQIHHKLHSPYERLFAVSPFDYKLAAVLDIAKAADVGVYPGQAGGPVFLEIPENYEDQLALSKLLEEADISFYETVGDEECE